MAQATAIRLSGERLTVAEVWAVACRGSHAELSDESRTKMTAARELVERAAHGSREHTYGVNTGFGRFVNRSIPEELTEELQLRLLRSHACGVGDPYPDEIVRAAMLLRANALAKGTSGARIETVEQLAVDRRVALAHEREREMRQRGEVSARAHRAARGHERQHAAIQALDEELDGLDARTREPLGERVRAQQHRRAHDLVGIGLADAARMAAEKAQLELLGELLRDVRGDEPAETRIHAVRVLAAHLLDQPARSRHPVAGRVAERRG